MKSITSILGVLLALVPFSQCLTPTFKIETPSSFSVLKKCNESTLYSIQTAAYSEYPIYLADIHGGSSYDLGYSYGYLLGNQSIENYDALLTSALPATFERDAFEVFLDWQWNDYLSKQVPQEFIDEMSGVGDGAAAAGFGSGLDKLMQRSIVIANFPGDITTNIEWLLWNEMGGNSEDIKNSLFESTEAKYKGMQCSHFAVWGSRTVNGTLFAGRNLDWLARSGISKNKVVTVFHPPGKISHVTFGFAGMIGSLAGMSSEGIVVTESGNDVKKETFDGFPWILRLRYIMMNSNGLQEARDLWENTNNTLGTNHLLASGKNETDLKSNHPALELETMKGYTAYFYDDDPRESQYIYVNQTTGEKYVMGWPMPEAVFRTNHGYDTNIQNEEVESYTPNSDTIIREHLFGTIFEWYQAAQIEIDYLEAVNTTSIPGNKGTEDFFYCVNVENAANILSVTFVPLENKAFFAFEDGSGSTYSPACCSTYIEIDFTYFF
eukprot:TRINITY_DN15272_c0_g1_i1.p1 TRINITY_DN15272_c0_g1~~TRINITY_DN15272_c0_g1_i1.p1  ORF type:complete len:494 (-),score=86.02 TRINITY_DN15272_c0_g1_i1:61-1542(-)